MKRNCVVSFIFNFILNINQFNPLMVCGVTFYTSRNILKNGRLNTSKINNLFKQTLFYKNELFGLKHFSEVLLTVHHDKF